MCRLDERLAQPAVALARLGTEPFARTDLGGWTQSGPGDQVRLAGEPVEPDTQFSHHDLGDALVDAGHLVQDVHHLSLAARWLRWRLG